MKRICDKCSSKFDAKSSFCPNCGDIVDEKDLLIVDATSPIDVNSVEIRIVCPSCEKQRLYNINESININTKKCKDCNEKIAVRLVRVRAKKSRQNKKDDKRYFSIRVINNDSTEDLIEFENDGIDDFELRSKDLAIFSYHKGSLKIVQNLSIGKFISIKNGCYISTHLYGIQAEKTYRLRRFRDDILRQTIIGKYIIVKYYTISPIVINKFGKHTLFNRISRVLVNTLLLVIKK